MKVSAGNAQHIGGRQQQQDSFGFSNPADAGFVRHGGFVGVVADGMGGLDHGQEASEAAVRSFLKAYEAKTPQEPVVNALSRSLHEANRAVLGLTAGSSSNDAGTTLAAATVVNGRLYWISAGDSRVYWIHNDRLTRLTADHTYATSLYHDVALGRMSLSEAHNHPERGSLTSYLGLAEPALLDRNLRPLRLDTNDCVLICSDGLYRGVTEDEIVAAVGTDPQRACESLVQLVIGKKRQSQDNVTAIAITYGQQHGQHIWQRKKLLLVLAAVILLLAAATGYWYGRYHFPWRTSVPPNARQQTSAPVTVSQPTTPTQSVTPSQSRSGQKPAQGADSGAGGAGGNGGANGPKPATPSHQPPKHGPPNHQAGGPPQPPSGGNGHSSQQGNSKDKRPTQQPTPQPPGPVGGESTQPPEGNKPTNSPEPGQPAGPPPKDPNENPDKAPSTPSLPDTPPQPQPQPEPHALSQVSDLTDTLTGAIRLTPSGVRFTLRSGGDTISCRV